MYRSKTTDFAISGFLRLIIHYFGNMCDVNQNRFFSNNWQCILIVTYFNKNSKIRETQILNYVRNHMK